MAALAALIIGSASVEEGGQPRAVLPFLGQSLVEYQARQAAAAGAAHVVILVERVPAALTAAVDRLKRDGIGAELARSVADAADRIHPDERLLLFGDGAIAAPELIARAANLGGAVVLTVADTAATLHHERIDAGARWAGLAMTDGAMLRRTASMLGEWDLQSTLLRRLVQSEVARIDAGAGVRLVDDAASARGAELDVLGAAAPPLLPAPVARRLLGEMLDRGVRAVWLRALALTLAGLGVVAVALGWLATGALALAASGAVDAVPRGIESVALRTAARTDPWRVARNAVFAAALVALGWRLARDGAGWGVWPLAAGNLLLAALLADLSRRLSREPGEPAWLALAFAPFAALGAAPWGLAATAIVLGERLHAGQRRIGRA